MLRHTCFGSPVYKRNQACSAPAQPVKQTAISHCTAPGPCKRIKANDEIVHPVYRRTVSGQDAYSYRDLKKILFFYDELKFSPDLIEYLIEYSVGRGHRSMRYIETVAIAWADEGITTVTMAKEASSRMQGIFYHSQINGNQRPKSCRYRDFSYEHLAE